MSLSLVTAWWFIPAAITIIGLVWALFIVKGEGFMGGLSNLFAVGSVAIVSAISWAVAGFLK